MSNAEKTAILHMRISPELKRQAEEVLSNCGLTMTDAVTIFLQQAVNVRGMPLLIMENAKEAIRQQAVAMLMTRLQQSESYVDKHAAWVSWQSVLEEFNIWLPYDER